MPKPNKTDYSVPKAYRIIILLNYLGKILERIIAKRLALYLEIYMVNHGLVYPGSKLSKWFLDYFNWKLNQSNGF